MVIVTSAAPVERVVNRKLGLVFLFVFILVGILFGGILNATVREVWRQTTYVEILAR